MNKSLLIPLLVATAAISACGKQSSYKAKMESATTTKSMIDPRSVNKVADAVTEQSAIDLLAQDQFFKSVYKSDASKIIKSNIRGVSLSLSANGSMTQAVLNLALKSENNECSPLKLEKSFNSSQRTIFVNFDENKRVRCVGKTCDQLLLVIQDKKQLSTGDENTAVMQDGAVAILLQKEVSSNVYKPVTTQSPEIYQVNNFDVGLQSCVLEAKRDEEAKKAKAKADATAKPASPIGAGTLDPADEDQDDSTPVAKPGVAASVEPEIQVAPKPKIDAGKVNNNDDEDQDDSVIQPAAPKGEMPQAADDDQDDSGN